MLHCAQTLNDRRSRIIVACLAGASNFAIIEFECNNFVLELDTMALPLSRLFAHLRLSKACMLHTRAFSSSSFVLARQSKPKLDEDFTADDVEVMAIDESSDVVDSPSGGHMMLNEHRETLHYLRLIELELPNLVGTFIHILPNCRSNDSMLSKLSENPLCHQYLSHLPFDLSGMLVRNILPTKSALSL